MDWILGDVARITISSQWQTDPEVRMAFLKDFGAPIPSLEALKTDHPIPIGEKGAPNSAMVEGDGVSITIWHTVEFDLLDGRPQEPTAAVKKKVLDALAKDILPEEK